MKRETIPLKRQDVDNHLHLVAGVKNLLLISEMPGNQHHPETPQQWKSGNWQRNR
jgi:hypothetical protein